MDAERAAKVIHDVQDHFKRLEVLGLDSPEGIAGEKDFYAASMILFTICNKALELGELLLYSKRIGMPTTYREIFKLLHKNGVISQDVEKKFERLVHYRNLLAHEYGSFEKEDVFKLYGLINVVEVLIKKAQEAANEK